MNEYTSILATAWSETLNGVSEIMGNQYAALGLTLPLVGVVIAIAKKLFKRSRG